MKHLLFVFACFSLLFLLSDAPAQQIEYSLAGAAGLIETVQDPQGQNSTMLINSFLAEGMVASSVFYQTAYFDFAPPLVKLKGKIFQTPYGLGELQLWSGVGSLDTHTNFLGGSLHITGNSQNKYIGHVDFDGVVQDATWQLMDIDAWPSYVLQGVGVGTLTITPQGSSAMKVCDNQDFEFFGHSQFVDIAWTVSSPFEHQLTMITTNLPNCQEFIRP